MNNDRGIVDFLAASGVQRPSTAIFPVWMKQIPEIKFAAYSG